MSMFSARDKPCLTDIKHSGAMTVSKNKRITLIHVSFKIPKLSARHATAMSGGNNIRPFEKGWTLF